MNKVTGFIVGMAVMALCAELYAACTGPYCWDDNGAYITNGVQFSAPAQLSLKSTSDIATLQVNATGYMIVCTNCVKNYLCVSTGTGAGAFVAISTYGALANAPHCQ